MSTYVNAIMMALNDNDLNEVRSTLQYNRVINAGVVFDRDFKIKEYNFNTYSFANSRAFGIEPPVITRKGLSLYNAVKKMQETGKPVFVLIYRGPDRDILTGDVFDGRIWAIAIVDALPSGGYLCDGDMRFSSTSLFIRYIHVFPDNITWPFMYIFKKGFSKAKGKYPIAEVTQKYSVDKPRNWTYVEISENTYCKSLLGLL